jgi:DNA-binding transcriptional LysR family regulator
MARGIQPNIALRCDSPEAVKTAVGRKAGLGILYRSVLEPDVRKDGFKILPLKGMKLAGGSFIVYHKDKPLSPAARDLLTLLRRYSQKPQPIGTP